jgi:hypothetical protein
MLSFASDDELGIRHFDADGFLLHARQIDAGPPERWGANCFDRGGRNTRTWTRTCRGSRANSLLM